MAKIDQGIQKLKDFTKRIAEASNLEGVPSRTEIMFSVHEDGSVSLAGESAQEYRNLVSDLLDSLSKTTNISLKTLERLVQGVILASLDLNERREEKSLPRRIHSEFARLHETLTSPPVKWMVFCRILGIDAMREPIKFGKVTFALFDERQEERIRQAVKRHQDKVAFIERVEENIKEIKGEKEGVVGIIEVDAIDAIAARITAVDYLRRVADILNFYAGILYRPHTVKVALPGETSNAHVLNISIVEEEPTLYNSHWEYVGPSFPFELDKIIFSDLNSIGIDRVNRILSTDKPNQFEQRILSSLQWAGRATVDVRREEAFLLYAIALESLVLPREIDADISYRLRVFVPHLIGFDARDRITIKENVQRLYAKRSQIVHQGTYTVSDSELSLMRHYCRTSIMSMLVGEPFKSMSSDDDLRKWFDNEVLK